MKKICAITMARGDGFFLRKWVDHYGAAFGRENLFVYLDGEDQEIPSFCEGVRVEKVPRVEGNVARADKGRIHFLSDAAATLLDRYDLAVGTDADEYLSVDPALGLSLAEYLSTREVRSSLSALGLDVGQVEGVEATLSEELPFLSQRSRAVLSPRYTKACILGAKLRWGSGFHRVKGHNFHIDPNLYLFHFGYADLDRIRARREDSDRIQGGWEAHMHRREEAVRICSEGPVLPWKEAVSRARRIETFLRPLHAWNKPALPGRPRVVEIPERFSKVL